MSRFASTATSSGTLQSSQKAVSFITWLKPFVTGLLLPLGFAPFHLPGLAILSLTFLFMQLTNASPKKALRIGFLFGVGALSLGVSWIYVSIHDFGELNIALAIFATLLFIGFLALYYALFAVMYQRLSLTQSPLVCVPLFACLWFFAEFFRSTCLGGFPWLLVGTSQIDTPLKHLLPILGTLGVSFYTAFIAALLGYTLKIQSAKKYLGLIGFIGLMFAPSLLSSNTIKTENTPIHIGIVQANLSMRNKWDDALFGHIMNYYQVQIESLVKKLDLVILPESAIPIPTNYASEFLDTLDTLAASNDAGVLLGIPNPSAQRPGQYYNSLLGVGLAKGIYFKQHLVPFGEYIPYPFAKLIRALGITAPNLTEGMPQQPLMQYKHYALAALICYELAYPELLREQLPKASWIVSVSDDGWFGHSLAVYQHLQMAQVLSKQTGRFQILSNNDGLSSLINTEGEIVETLPAFSQDVLAGKIYPATGTTPWVYWGDKPIIIFNICLIILLIGARLSIAAKEKRRYPNQPN